MRSRWCARDLLAIVSAAALAGACTGVIGDPVGGGDGDPDPGSSAAAGGGTGASASGGQGGQWMPGGDPGAPPPDPYAAGTLPLSLLTNEQYENTIRDLLGDDSHPAKSFPGEVRGSSGFATVGTISDVNVERYADAAEALATNAMKTPAKIAPCAAKPDAGIDCVDTVLATFGRRAFRRPLSKAETDAHRAYYEKVRKDFGYGFADGLRLLLTAMLQSPSFLYRWEITDAPAVKDGTGGVVHLGAYQLASRLSYFLWGSMPDDALLDAAAKGELADPGKLANQARRLLQDPRAARAIGSFHLQWLELEHVGSATKSPTLYPELDDGLRSAMVEEVRQFSANVIQGGGGKLATLLTADFTWANPKLAGVYGAKAAAGDAFAKIALDGGRRAGLLTMPAVMVATSTATEGNPILRGKLVRERVLCESLVAPPPGIPGLGTLDPNLPMRERLQAHTKTEPCATCHKKTDPIGFGMGHYDAIGRWIDKDHGKPVDATGILYGVDGKDVPFDGAVALAKVLAGSQQVRSCLTKQWMRFSYGRGEASADFASLDGAYAAFQKSDFDVRELLVALAVSRSFRMRVPSPGEVNP